MVTPVSVGHQSIEVCPSVKGAGHMYVLAIGWESVRMELSVLDTVLLDSVHIYNESEKYRLPSSVSELDEYICGYTRTGVLCGECRDDYSASYHSYSYACISNKGCTYGWVLYLVSELLPLIIFFIIVIVFNVSFTSGAINSFVLFAQLQDGLAVLGDSRVYHSSVHHYFILVSESISCFSISIFSV